MEDVDARSEATFRFTVPNLKYLTDKVLSPPFYVRHLPWKIAVMPRLPSSSERQQRKSLAFYLECNGDDESTSWSCYATAELRLIPQKPDTEPFIRKIQHLFNSDENDWGFSCFMAWDDVLNPNKGFIKNNEVTFEVHCVAEMPRGVSPVPKKRTGCFAVTGSTAYPMCPLAHSRGRQFPDTTLTTLIHFIHLLDFDPSCDLFAVKWSQILLACLRAKCDAASTTTDKTSDNSLKGQNGALVKSDVITIENTTASDMTATGSSSGNKSNPTQEIEQVTTEEILPPAARSTEATIDSNFAVASTLFTTEQHRHIGDDNSIINVLQRVENILSSLLNTTREQHTETDRDEFYYFALSVAAQLRKLPTHIAVDAQNKIQSTLSTGRLTSMISNTPASSSSHTQ